MPAIDLKGRVALVTGAGAGLGRAYAIQLASLGAAVLVNDPAVDKATGKSTADTVVAEIVSAGGKAMANKDLLTKELASAEGIVQSAIKAFGKLDIIVNNAGILRDVSFAKQGPEDWALVQEVHLWGQRHVCKAAWDKMIGQGYGRIVNIGSINGQRGMYGQSNYAAAKSGIVGLTKTLAMEGEKRNVKVNMVLPAGGTAMTATVMPDELVKIAKPELAAPMVAFLASDYPSVPTGRIFEAGPGFFAEWQWRRSNGVAFDITKPLAVDDVAAKWGDITDMSNCTDPIEEDKQLPKHLTKVVEFMKTTRKKSKL
uniref:Peroxisome multifunctional protein n=1 Tax=Gambierdiscus pacificus TaxID=439314 RepID=A0A6M5KF80_9DINO|nr:peroxisome multifunctional protein [Gambierdiscus pacificus]